MKKTTILTFVSIISLLTSCIDENRVKNTSALKEQEKTELNQRDLLAIQPPPKISWSLERDNLIKRFKLQNDRTIMFYMYVFIEGISEPIGYYQVNKVSSVNSQLTNPEQIISGNEIGNDLPNGTASVISSPSEDGSYGTNGDAVFGFTPEEIYIEHNLKYIVATVPLNFTKPVNRLTVINIETEKQLKEMMNKVNKK